MNHSRTILMATCILFLISLPVSPLAGKKKKEGFHFSIEKEIPHTPVKAQSRTGTCWCFATVSFLESEFLRTGTDPELDLSEMYIVRHTYPDKADNYVRLHGRANFSQGGQSHDVISQVRKHGLVPEQVYDGMNLGKKIHDHGELVRVLQGFMEGLLSGRRRFELTPNWKNAFACILNAYLGTPPREFTYRGKTYSPRSFADEYLGLNLADYVEFTSYQRYPFYQTCRLELPDNWTYDDNYYNLPLNDLESLTDEALRKGYTVVWDGDVSEEFFSSRKKGIAIVPAQEDLEFKELKGPVKEKEVTQEMREKTFESFATTDDHLMHIVGIARDRQGKKYYYIKNSGGTERANKGYVYMSRSYFRLKTTALMVNRRALTENLRNKLKL